MKAVEYLTKLPWLPRSTEGRISKATSNSEVRRWLNKRAVRINGVYPKAGDKINFPIKELVFFPKSKRKTTMMLDDGV